MDSKLIGKKLRQFREYKKLNLSELAEVLGISEGHLRNIEFGQKKITIEIFMTLKENLCSNLIDYEYLLEILGINYKNEKEENEVVSESDAEYSANQITLLERLLAEKERTIQILLGGK